ncbi:MAG: MBL fold metallo-hydrolase [Myxococcota bacterium]|jgi:glyoxylase-like metal-dependent hydrolase (beta-lactamase superfamily II)|nr:MBL fold metallo-hydrolase [Myxococcota bacterium]
MTAKPDWIEPLELSMTATLGKVNVYLIRGQGDAALVDTGMNDATSRADLERALANAGLRLDDIGTVVCTHHHADHAGLGATFRALGAKVLMSEADARSLSLFFESPELDESRATFYGKHEVPKDFSSRVNAMFPLFRRMAERFEPTELLCDGQKLALGGHPFEVVLTPGHTMGHVCLRSEEQPFVVTGDCVLAEHGTHVSMRPEMQGLDPVGAFFDSLDKLARMGIELGLPGHGPFVTALAERCGQLRGIHEARLRHLRDVLTDVPLSAFEISEQIMGPRPKVFAIWLALSQTLGYLGYLSARKLVREDIAPDGRVRYARVTSGSLGTTCPFL